MREPQQTFHADEEVTLVVSGEEATLVAPRFDDEETLVARPVVPLGAEAAEAPAPPVTPRSAFALPAYARRRLAPRRSWVLALVLVSVLVGGVLGGAGLYLYQRQSNDAAVAPPQAETPSETRQQPAPTAEVSDAPPPAAPATDAPAEAGPAEAATGEAAPPASEPETAPAAERDTPDAGGSAGTRRRGKKGEHDDEIGRPRREAGPDSGGPVARADDSGAREARRVDTIFYRPRRAERRAERRAARRARREAGDTDRLRRIFEGTPE